MKILFIGDVYGRSGRDAIKKYLPDLKSRLKPDVVVVNVDNVTNGHGISVKHIEQMYECGADVLTGGDHVWDQREMIPYIDRDPAMLRPINFSNNAPGKGTYIFETDSSEKCLIIHLAGRVFMNTVFDDPFAAIKKIVDAHPLGRNVNAIFVDFHAEATSEKMALGQYLDGKVSAVVGSHTHVPTADAHILHGGTAYQTDAGMTGDFDSIIGARKDIPLQKFLNGYAVERMVPANGEGTICGCFIVTNDKTGLAQSIQPIRVGGQLAQAFPEA